MTTQPRLLQNALYFPEHDHYLKSSHVHDYREFEYRPGCFVHTDGGLEYIHRSIPSVEHRDLIVDWDLTTDSTPEETRAKLLWGSLPLDPDKPQIHTFRPIALLTKGHLLAIWTDCLNASPLHREVVRHWLDQKKA